MIEGFFVHPADLDIIQGSVVVFWLTCALAVFVVSITKAGFGGSVGALAAPIMLTVLPAKLALAVLLPLYLLADFWTVYLWRGYALRTLLIWMCGCAIAGQIVGWLIICYVDDNMLKLIIGAIALMTGARFYLNQFGLSLVEVAKNQHRKIRKKFKGRAVIWCGLSGLSSFVSLTGGIPVQVFMLPMQIQRFFVVGTLAWYFLVINLAKIPFFLQLDWFSVSTLNTSIYLIPLVPAGVFVGRWLNRNISDKLFYHIAHIALIALGIRLIVTNIAGFG